MQSRTRLKLIKQMGKREEGKKETTTVKQVIQSRLQIKQNTENIFLYTISTFRHEYEK